MDWADYTVVGGLVCIVGVCMPFPLSSFTLPCGARGYGFSFWPSCFSGLFLSALGEGTEFVRGGMMLGLAAVPDLPPFGVTVGE